MADWDPAVPAIANDISTDISTMSSNFGVIATAWSGDHVALTGDGSGSVNHDKVSLVAQAVATPAASVGILYCDSGNSNDLYFAYPTGGTYSTARLTQSGNTAGGADVFCTFDGTSASPITPSNSKNVTNVTKSATGQYVINIPAGILSDANYTAIIQPKPSDTLSVPYVISQTKTATTLSFNTVKHPYAAKTAANYDSPDVNVVIFRNG